MVTVVADGSSQQSDLEPESVGSVSTISNLARSLHSSNELGKHLQWLCRDNSITSRPPLQNGWTDSLGSQLNKLQAYTDYSDSFSSHEAIV